MVAGSAAGSTARIGVARGIGMVRMEEQDGAVAVVIPGKIAGPVVHPHLGTLETPRSSSSNAVVQEGGQHRHTW